jgi:hypothetical protein
MRNQVAYQAAQRMTISTETKMARLAMIITRRRISFCSVVSEVGEADASLAIRPLACLVNRKLRHSSGNSQYRAVTGLNDNTSTGATDADGSLESNVFGLNDQYLRKYGRQYYSEACLKEIIVCLLNATRDRFTLEYESETPKATRKRRIVPLQSKHSGQIAGLQRYL